MKLKRNKEKWRERKENMHSVGESNRKKIGGENKDIGKKINKEMILKVDEEILKG